MTVFSEGCTGTSCEHHCFFQCLVCGLRLSPPDDRAGNRSRWPDGAAGGRAAAPARRRPSSSTRASRPDADRASRDRGRDNRSASSILVPPHHARRTASSRTAVRPVAYCGLFSPPDHTGQATTESRLTSYVTVTTTIPAAAPPVAASSASRPREGKRPAAAARPRPPPTGSRSPLVRCAVL